MKTTKTAALAVGLAMMATPALAVGPPDNPGPPAGTPTGTDNPGSESRPATPGPKAGLPAKARAYGRYCNTQSRKRVEGEKGTPFSKCVSAGAKLLEDEAAAEEGEEG